MISHMITSAPSSPPRSAYCAIVSSVRLLGVLLEQLEELHVPGRVVEAGPLAVHLVREAAGGDDRHLQILRVALDRLAQGPAEPEAAPRGGDRELEHPDLQRHDGARASCPSCGHSTDSGEKQPWSSGFAWKYDRSNSVGGERRGDVAGELGVALDRRQLARPAALIGHRVLLADAEREVRVVVEEERGDVVVVDEEQHVGLLLRAATAAPAGSRRISAPTPDRSACSHPAQNRSSACATSRCRLRSSPCATILDVPPQGPRLRYTAAC